MRQIRDLRATLLFGIGANLLTGSLPLSVLAASAASLWNNVKLLNAEELELLLILERATNQNPYSSWVSFGELSTCTPDELNGRTLLELLGSMQSRGILEEAGGLWRAVK